ncbi:MAG: hypothetical protein QOD99_512 [Chthoniobacter sp.]|nr:hypothetical protein [Chthoniobacter sp.]
MSVAVVIPLYNHERYIGEALESVFAQTLRVQSIIIVDDGSRDDSVAAVSKFADERIRLFQQANSGAHAALNRGIAEAAADHEFVAILNSDDVYEPERIAECVKYLQENPEIQVVCTRLKMIDENSRDLAITDPKTRWLERLWQARRENLPEWLGIANFTKTSSNFVARSAYLLDHPFRAYRYVHDYFFAAVAAMGDELAVLPKQLLRYRAHSSNTIKSDPPENVTREVLAMNIDLLRTLAPRLAREPEARANYTQYFRALCRNYSDFRAEVFLGALAQLLAGVPTRSLAEYMETLSAENFPELSAAKTDALKEELAHAEYEALLRQIGGSNWLALGRVFGAGVDIWRAAPTAQKRLAALRQQCASSRWFRLGQRLGLVYTDV